MGGCFGSNRNFRDGCADLVGLFCLFHDPSCFCRRAILALSDIHQPGTDQFSRVLLPQFATLVAQIKAIPFALYFSSVREDRRLPKKLARLRSHPQISEQDRKNLDILLRELPGLEHVAQDSFNEAFDDWAKGYTLRPEES